MAYQIVDRKDCRALAEFLSREGQLLLPMPELIEQADPSLLRTSLVGRPARLAEEAVVATEGFNLQTVAGSKNARDHAAAMGEQPAGDDYAKGLEGRLGKTRSKLKDRRLHGRWEKHNTGLLPKSPGNPFPTSRTSAGGPLF
jgi:hypothetical protein